MSFTPVNQRPRGAHGHLVSTSEALAWVHAVVAEKNGTGCRDWPGSCNAKGYAQMGYQGRTTQVGQIVLELSGRHRPAGAQQLHSCDRPICAAPWHLSWGTNSQNRAEMMARGRSSKGEHRPQAKLTDAAVREIRTSRDRPGVLARRFGVAIGTVLKVQQGLTWKHVRAEDDTVAQAVSQ